MHNKTSVKLNNKTSKLIWCFILFIGKIPINWSKKIGLILGDMIRFIDKRHRYVATDNLEYAYGLSLNNKTKKNIIKKVYRNLTQTFFELGWLTNTKNIKSNSRIKIFGNNHIQNALKKNKGVLIISGHIGAWEVLPYIISKIGVSLNIIYRPLDFEPLDQVIKKIRSQFGARLIPVKHSIKKIEKAINKNEAVGLLIDQSADWYNGVWVDFFGHRTCTSKGAAQIATVYKTPVIPVFIIREKNTLKIKFKKEVQLHHSNDFRKNVEKNTSNFTKIIEKEIRNNPEQWFWLHRRWKNKPYTKL